MTPTPDNRGQLPAGTRIPQGVVRWASLTAYYVRDAEGLDGWVSFDRVHGRPAPVMPLVTLGGW